MQTDIVITILFLIFAMVMFFLEKIPVLSTAMIVLVGFMVTGILEPKEAFAGLQKLKLKLNFKVFLMVMFHCFLLMIHETA